jgi:RNA polymerase sigma-70 factor (ECF subfamily)
VTLSAGGGPSSPETLVKCNLGWLRGWLAARLSGRDAAEADDLCQEVLLRALRSARALRDPERFPGWLYRIAANVLHDYLRQKARRRRLVRSLEVEVEDPRDAAAAVDLGEELKEALGAVLALPATYREPMLLKHVEDLSYAEIGKILGLSQNAVQVRIFRAREMLRQKLRKADAPREAVTPSNSHDPITPMQ